MCTRACFKIMWKETQALTSNIDFAVHACMPCVCKIKRDTKPDEPY